MNFPNEATRSSIVNHIVDRHNILFVHILFVGWSRRALAMPSVLDSVSLYSSVD